jgi:lysophospholipase L1-like esterase
MHRIAAGLAMATVMLAGSAAGAAPALAASHTGKPAVNVSTYYLSLGDSLAQGVQPNAQGVSVETNQGYPNQLYTALSQTDTYLRLVKLGCPGETTATMINGGICTYGEGSQLAQAVEFLQKHPGRVPLVTIDIGANDLNPCLVLTSLPKLAACLEKVIPQAVANLGQIMTELRAADPAPGAIIGMSYYDPELANWLKGTKASRTLATDSVTLAEIFNKDLSAVYKAAGAPTANVFGAFRTADLTDMVTTPEFGTIPLDVAKLCTYTWQCAAPPVGPNEHANILGYGVIANAFFNTYAKLISAS